MLFVYLSPFSSFVSICIICMTILIIICIALPHGFLAIHGCYFVFVLPTDHLLILPSVDLLHVSYIFFFPYLSLMLWSPEEAAKSLANTFSKKASYGTSGVINVRTESWNSKDGVTKRTEKSQAWGGSIHC